MAGPAARKGMMRGKQHPDLIPYAQLPESEKEYDRNSARETIKAIISLGFNFRKKL